MSDSDHGTPEECAEKMVSQLGGPLSARNAAVKYKQTAQSRSRRMYWSSVIAYIDGNWDV